MLHVYKGEKNRKLWRLNRMQNLVDDVIWCHLDFKQDGA